MHSVFVTHLAEDTCCRYVAIDQDVAFGTDFVGVCTYDTLRSMLDNKNLSFKNVHCENDGVWASTIRTSGFEETSSRVVPLKSKKTIWDFFEVLINKDAKFLWKNNWVSFSELFACPNADKVIYRETGAVLWSLDDLEEIPSRELTVSCPTDVFETFISSGFEDYWDILTTGEVIQFTINLNKLSYTWDFSYILLRFCPEELSYLAGCFQMANAQLLGISLGHNFMMEISNINSGLQVSKNLQHSNFGCISFDFFTDLPDVGMLTEILCRNFDKLKAALSNYSMATFSSVCQKIFSSRDTVFADAFVKGFLSQISQNGDLKDYEYQIMTTALKKKLAAISVDLFRYKIAMLSAPLDIPDNLELCQGVLHIERR